MAEIKKAIWLSYDLGIGGDYPGFYKWLDNHKAKECGNSVAYFEYTIDESKLDELPQTIYEDIHSVAALRPGDRLYLIHREVTSSFSGVKGSFICCKRKSNPWEGYGDAEISGSEGGE